MASETAGVPAFVDASANPSVVADATSVTVSPGKTATFKVALSKAPASTTTVTIARAAGVTTVSVAPAALTFTPSTWNTGQAVTVSATAAAATNTSATFTAGGTGLTAATVTALVVAEGSADGRFTSSTRTSRIRRTATSAPRACRTTRSRR